MLVFRDFNQKPTIVDIVKKIVETRFQKKQNTFFVVVGQPGSGKSYTALKFAEAIDPNFSPKDQIIYLPNQFEEVYEFVKRTDRKVIIFDECHVTMPSRRWFSFTNMALNQIMSTFRQIKNLAVFFVTPVQNLVDKQIRMLFNYYCFVEKKMGKNGFAVMARLYEISLNYFDLRDQNPYLKSVYVHWNGSLYKVGRMKVPMPSERVVEEYEKISREFKENVIRREIGNFLRKKGGDKNGEG